MKILRFIVMLIISTCSIVSYAQSPIEFIVKSAPGGPEDILARRLVDHLQYSTDMKIVIFYKPGAGHTIGYSHFANTQNPSLIIGDVLFEKHPEAFSIAEHLYTLGEFSNILFVRKKSEIKSLNDLIKLSKTREIKFGHGGIGSFSHIAASLMCEKINCLMVPYKSGASGMVDLLTGQIDAFSLVTYGSSVYMENDSYTPIVMYSTVKHPKYNAPLLPTTMKNIEIKNWVSLFSKNLSPKQNKEIIKAMSTIDKSFFIDSGLWVK